MAPLDSFPLSLASLFERALPSSAPRPPVPAGDYLRARDSSAHQNYKPGGGIVSPTTISNSVIFGLFGLISMAFVLAGIWFFFFAKNGGFRFRTGDWDDYKSTVLRRKGPNGTTLSAATKSTKLGGGSVLGSLVSEEEEGEDSYSDVEKADRRKRMRKSKNRHDPDVRAYRSERPARVGGLNREPDGSYHDYSSTEPSEMSRGPAVPHHHYHHPRPKEARSPRSRQFSYNANSEDTFSTYSGDLHRPSAQQHRYDGSPRHSRQASPTKHEAPRAYRPASNRYSSRASEGTYTEPLDMESRYGDSELGSAQVRNTKAYFHPLPGLGKSSYSGGGFRRGGPGSGRRDSLSDSDGETNGAR